MTSKIIIAGFGGQGVLSLGQFIAYSAIEQDLQVTWMPSYGPEMRGGTANCNVVVSDKPVANPIITNPDCLIALNLPSLLKFEGSVVPGGLIVVNGSLVKERVKRSDVKARYIDCEELAEEAGNKKAANTILLGALIRESGIITPANVEKGIEYMLKNKPHLIDVNKKVFNIGLKL
jgi:2-oxoglutarate ferredoxin oxidoreductase subunit gamma